MACLILTALYYTTVACEIGTIMMKGPALNHVVNYGSFQCSFIIYKEAKHTKSTSGFCDSW